MVSDGEPWERNGAMSQTMTVSEVREIYPRPEGAAVQKRWRKLDRFMRAFIKRSQSVRGLLEKTKSLLARIPFCGEWRGAILMRIMPPVPSRVEGWERAAQDARLACGSLHRNALRRFARTPRAWRRAVPMQADSGPRLLFPANLLRFRALHSARLSVRERWEFGA